MSEPTNPSPPPAAAAAANAQQPVSAAPAKANGTRRRALIGLSTVVLIAGAGWGAYEYLVASHYEDTDNAYVQGNVIQITPQIGGTVTSIFADDTDYVKAGQPLIKLDPSDAKVALDQAEAALAQSVRQVRTVYANNGSLSAQVALRQADVQKIRTDLARAQGDLKRRQSLSGNGAVSGEELGHAQSQVAAARSAEVAAKAAVTAAREQLNSNRSLTEGTGVAKNPAVLAAAAKVREAYLATQRTELPAPVDGYVAKRTVQLGQRVAAGTPMMSIVPLGQLWVEANFKEPQLRSIRIDQPVKLVSDLYGSNIEYHGKVAGLGAGTGAAFALLPAQNATGNWIKVVQRVPVRIELDPKELKANPLRVGLSMEATIDITDQNGRMLASAASTNAPSETLVYDTRGDGADAVVQRIIDENLGAAEAGKAPAAKNAAADKSSKSISMQKAASHG